MSKLWGLFSAGFMLSCRYANALFALLRYLQRRKALGVKLSDFFDTDDKLADVNSYDASIMEKIKLVEELNDEEKKIVFSLVDALVGKKKLKDALSGVLQDVK